MRKVLVFLGGGVRLLHGGDESFRGYRNDVIDPIVSQLNSLEYAEHLFITKDYSDLTRNVVKGKQQRVYNNFIVHESHIALFIVDGKIGNITKHEIDIAVGATRKNGHPIVYVYGKNIGDDDEILDYLNQEGIYFQHFFDNRDLATKIKADLETSAKKMDRKRVARICTVFVLSLILLISILLSVRHCSAGDEKVIGSCTAQLYLMRYHDINVLTGENIFDDNLLSNFKYEDSVMLEKDISVFPLVGCDSVIKTTPPFFRLKLHNRHRNTIVFVEAWLEVDEYIADTIAGNKSFASVDLNLPDVNTISIDGITTEYKLKGFRQNVAYGETDDRYYFDIVAKESCSFRMRIKIKSQLGDYLYSNYIYMKYVK